MPSDQFYPPPPPPDEDSEQAEWEDEDDSFNDNGNDDDASSLNPAEDSQMSSSGDDEEEEEEEEPPHNQEEEEEEGEEPVWAEEVDADSVDEPPSAAADTNDEGEKRQRSVSFKAEDDDDDVEDVEIDPLVSASNIEDGQEQPSEFVDDNDSPLIPDNGEDEEGSKKDNKCGQGVCGCICTTITAVIASICALGGVALCLICVLILLIIIVPIVLLVGLDIDGSNESSSSDKSPELPALDLKLPAYTTQTIESNSQSPQFKAYEWLQKDPFLSDYDENRQLQRFAMASMYYAFRGENWTNSNSWLNYEVSECFWGEPTSTPFIQCGNNETVLEDVGPRPTAAPTRPPTRAPTTTSPQTTAPTIGNADNNSTDLEGNADNNSTDLEDETQSGNSTDSDGPIVDDPTTTITTKGSNIFDQKRRGLLRRRLQNNNDDLDDWHVLALHMPKNNLEGTIPPEISLLTDLVSINWNDNNVFGSIPTEPLTALTQLVSLSARTNLLTGAIPSEIRGLKNVAHLDFSENQLNATLPTQLAALPLLTLDLSRNQLQGRLLKNVSPWVQSLESLRLHHNQFTGVLETTMGLLQKLKHLELDANKLRGSLPSQLGSLINLEEIMLYSNDFTSTIPTQFGTMASVKKIEMANNKLSGPIPSEIGLLNNLEELWLYDNQLTGTIPKELNSLANQSLTHVVIYDNDGLTGEISPGLCAVETLQFFCEPLEGLCGCDCPCGPPGNETNSTDTTVPPSLGGNGTVAPAETEAPTNVTLETLVPTNTTVETEPPFNEETIAPTNATDTVNTTVAPTGDEEGLEVGNETQTSTNGTLVNDTGFVPFDPGNGTNSTVETTITSGAGISVEPSRSPDFGLEDRYGIRSVLHEWDQEQVTLKYQVSDYIMDSSIQYVLYDGLNCRRGANDITGDNNYLFIDLKWSDDGGVDLTNDGQGSRGVELPFTLNREEIVNAPFFFPVGLEKGRLSFCVGLIVNYNQGETWDFVEEVNAVEVAIQMDIDLLDFRRIEETVVQTIVRPIFN